MMTRSERIRNGSLLTDCENRAGSEVTSNGKLKVWLELFEKRHAGSWLSQLPLTINWKFAGTRR